MNTTTYIMLLFTCIAVTFARTGSEGIVDIDTSNQNTNTTISSDGNTYKLHYMSFGVLCIAFSYLFL